jgi:phosphatidylinositol alpha-mannosyltransferase
VGIGDVAQMEERRGAAGVRIAFPYPSYWPYVRRGAERCIHDLSTHLARRGHDVEIITSAPGRPRVAFDGDVKVTYLRQVSHPLMYRYLPRFRIAVYGADASRHLVRERPDVAHLLSFSYVNLAPVLRAWLDMPFVFQVIMRNHYWTTRYQRFMYGNLVRSADLVCALTQGGAEAITQQYGVPCEVLPPPVDTEHFRPVAHRDHGRPTVLFPADLADPRKGASLLFKAWNRVHADCPDAVLALAGPVGMAGYSQDRGERLFGQLALVRDARARAQIEFWGPGDRDGLPRWYSEAAVTVLPSVEEAFGMVLVESLACGTPVVGSAFDGPGEIITDPRVGATVALRDWSDLDNTKLVDELAGAILTAIDLSRREETTRACRVHAEQWSVERVGVHAEAMLSSIVDARRARRKRAA